VKPGGHGLRVRAKPSGWSNRLRGDLTQVSDHGVDVAGVAFLHLAQVELLFGRLAVEAPRATRAVVDDAHRAHRLGQAVAVEASRHGEGAVEHTGGFPHLDREPRGKPAKLGLPR